ncbi:tetratricopeptide repeat protein [Plectonema cf. radiosum LEGE 06105]|uniref:Tetratricopeptide repeat protein n=1 Tax=Plectonema cf. radiosum LEGE 06105 TaxID=945769 RepID=A0A8J7F2N8_9CYAN|nr:tetratricopeptide repeat protein [Plectonema radiosum]MBE9213782.1 tetratricopeptide repeat protein [Plectonema cf. radiosum LEGE 06105]
MKFPFSIPSVLTHTSSILLLSFSLPLITPILASNNPDECRTPKPPQLNTVDDFISMGLFQMECEKDSQAAISSYTQAIQLNPQVVAPYYQRANAYFKIGNYKAAVKDYTEVINKNAGRSGSGDVAYWNRARAYEKLGEKQKAISDLTEYIRDSGSSAGAETYFYRANLYRDLGDKNNAIQDYKAADKILREDFNMVFAISGIDPMYQEMIDKVRTELSQLGVSVPEPDLATAKILKSIAEIEVERALNLAKFKLQNPLIRKFDAQLQDLYKQLENTQAQPLEGIEKGIISNTARIKIERLKVARSQLTTKYNPTHPEIVLINSQIKQLEALISRNRM